MLFLVFLHSLVICHYGTQDCNLVFPFLPLLTCAFLLYILSLAGSHISFLVVRLILSLVFSHFDIRFSNFSVHFFIFPIFLLFFVISIPLSLSCFFFLFFITVYALSSIIFYGFNLLLFDCLIFLCLYVFFLVYCLLVSLVIIFSVASLVFLLCILFLLFDNLILLV